MPALDNAGWVGRVGQQGWLDQLLRQGSMPGQLSL